MNLARTYWAWGNHIYKFLISVFDWINTAWSNFLVVKVLKHYSILRRLCVQQTNFQIYLQLSDMISLAKNDLSVEKKFHICYIGNYATYDIHMNCLLYVDHMTIICGSCVYQIICGSYVARLPVYLSMWAFSYIVI